MNDRDRARYCRDRAEELRVKSEYFPRSRDSLLGLADDWEILAEMREQLAVIRERNEQAIRRVPCSLG